MATKIAKTQKQVTIICRAQFKSDSRKVCFQCLSSNGKDTYWCCLYNGVATGCSCPASGRCYHMTGCERLEAERQAKAAGKSAEQVIKQAEPVEKLDGDDALVSTTAAEMIATEMAKVETQRAVEVELKSAVFAELKKCFDHRSAPANVEPKPEKYVPIAQRGSLNGSRAFSLLKR